MLEFAEVLLPLAIPGTFTYRVPEELSRKIETGIRVVVPFGRSKLYTGLVISRHQNEPSGYQAKNILYPLDDYPVVNSIQLEFWKWLAEYYMCNLGEVLQAALPSAFRLASETRVYLNPVFDGDLSVLNDREYNIVEALNNHESLSITDLSKLADVQKIFPLIRNLIDKQIILVEEEIKEIYRPRTESYVKLSKDFQNEEALKKLMDDLQKRAFKQLEILMVFLQQTDLSTNPERIVKKSELLSVARASSEQMNALIKKGVFEIIEKKVSRLESSETFPELSEVNLTPPQEQAYQEILNLFENKDVVLLHGVTSSGKTEIYVKFIQEVIESGKQVLFLLPEIALTAQIIGRMRRYFGDKVGVYHSRYNQMERVEIWNRVLQHDAEGKSENFQIILGARSALFLPFTNLGLVIVDEEHDTSYKQYSPSPRYHARDAAIVLASLHGAKVILGSATPSLESYSNAVSGKFGLVNLTERYGGLELPEIIICDLRVETRKKTLRSHFSSILLEHIQKALERKEQIILFQNRRGFSLRLECGSCHWMPSCKYCDVTLVYHKSNNHLRCHYCGYTSSLPQECPECRHTGLLMKGFGTEKVEDNLRLIFPDAVIERMDLDTTRSKYAHQKIISDFENRKIDILVGTQMITKGLDFDNVSVVGILNADNLISYPDFRSAERSFQLMAQVSGRAGRKFKRGKVIIQTYRPNNEIIQYVLHNRYDLMYRHQMAERKKFHYPPYYRLIQIQLQHKNEQTVSKAAEILASMLRQSFNQSVVGPEFPIVSKIQGIFLKNILLKLKKTTQISIQKQQIREIIHKFELMPEGKTVRVVVDVDPM